MSPFICSFFFLSNGNFCQRFHSSYCSQCFRIVCKPLGRQNVLCKLKLRCESSFCLLFFNFSFFFLLLLLYNTYGHFSVKAFSATTRVRILKFGTKLDSDKLYCVTVKSGILLISPFICLFLHSNENILSQISPLLLEPVFSFFLYTFK